MKANGESAKTVYLAALHDGTATDKSLRIIRLLFDLTLQQALSIVDEADNELFGRYRTMKDNGATPLQVLEAANEEGFDQSFQLKLLRAVFLLSLKEAKEYMVIIK